MSLSSTINRASHLYLYQMEGHRTRAKVEDQEYCSLCLHRSKELAEGANPVHCEDISSDIHQCNIERECLPRRRDLDRPMNFQVMNVLGFRSSNKE